MNCYMSVYCLLVCLANPLQADVLWEWDFTEEPAGWIWTNSWDFNDSGANLYYHLWDFTGAYSPEWLISPDLSIPASAAGKELNISFWHWFDFSCGVYDGAIWTWIEARVILNSDTSYAYNYYGHEIGIMHTWSYHTASDSGSKSITIGPVQEGDILKIEYYFYYYENGYYQNYCNMDWLITDLKVEESNTELSRYTWGSIKSGFR